MPSEPAHARASDSVAIVMSGGGARGAYEAGVLSYVLDVLPRRLGRPVRIDIATGASVGAIHACYVAATLGKSGAGERLTKIWRSLSFESVYNLGAVDLFRIPWRLMGFGGLGDWLPAQSPQAPERMAGLLNTTALETQVLEHIPWKQLRRNIDTGRIRALAVAATEIATGRSVVFVDQRGKADPHWTGDPFIVARSARIGPFHALASASIPLVFPAVRIDRTYYCDGGLRLNTPLSPALRLGADRIFVIGLRYPVTPENEDKRAQRREEGYMSTVYLAGKILNAFLLDRVEYDVDRLRLFNAILESGTKVYGDGFLDEINKPILQRRNAPYRIVRNLFLHPSRDLGELADECLRHQPRSSSLRIWISRSIARYAARGAFGEADLLSYLFFDRCYADHLIELGRRDAENAADDLLSFFS